VGLVIIFIMHVKARVSTMILEDQRLHGANTLIVSTTCTSTNMGREIYIQDLDRNHATSFVAEVSEAFLNVQLNTSRMWRHVGQHQSVGTVHKMFWECCGPNVHCWHCREAACS